MVNGQMLSWGRMDDLFSLKATVSGNGSQTVAILPLDWTDGNGFHEPVLECQGWEKSLNLGQAAPLVSRICEDAQRSQDRVPSPQNYAAWKSALAL